MRRRRLAPASLVVLALALAACSTLAPPAATVDGARITDAQIASDVPLFRFLGSLNNSSCGQPLKGETEESACARSTLSNLIQEDLVKEYASAHHLSVPDSEVQTTVSNLESSMGTAQLEAQLKAQGLTRIDLSSLARRLLLFGAVQRAVAAARVTDQELHALYDQQKQTFTQINARNILVDTERLANRIERIVTRRNFGPLARKFSTDTTSATAGGDLGTVSATSLDPAFVQAALALQRGEISAPVHTSRGWNIILLESVSVTPFDQVRQQLLDQQSSQLFDTWLKERLRAADISVNPKYGRLDVATGEILPIRTTATGSPSALVSASPSPAVTVSP
jgi:foldase protein PrsA